MAYSVDNFSVMSVQFVQYSLDYFLKTMLSLGFKHVEFWGGSPHFCRLNYATEADIRCALDDIKSKINRYGLGVVMYTPETLNYPMSLSSPDDTLRNYTVDFLKKSVDDALLLGAKQLFINSGCALRDTSIEEAWSRLEESVSSVCHHASEKGIDVVIEQLQPYESNLITDIRGIRRLLKNVNSSALKVCLDVVAMEVAGETIDDYFSEFGDRVCHVHFSDRCHYVLGDGDYPLKEMLNQLEVWGYKGYISLEINDSIYWQDPYDSLLRSKQVLDKLLLK